MQKREVTKQFANKVLDEYIQIFKQLPNIIENIFNDRLKIQKLAALLSDRYELFILGGIDFPTCCEGALKIKEICNIHAEAIPSGELKHGSLSLIRHNTYCILVSTGVTNQHDISCAAEIKSRGGRLITIISDTDKNKILKDTADFCFVVPNLGTGVQFAQSLTVIYFQLLAYYIAVHKGMDPDKPRNLAKSMIIE